MFCLNFSLRILSPESVRTNSGFIFLIDSSDCFSINSFGEEQDGHIHVVRVRNISNERGILVKISIGSYYIDRKSGFPVDFKELISYGFPQDAPLFVPIGGYVSNNVGNLKNLNTK